VAAQQLALSEWVLANECGAHVAQDLLLGVTDVVHLVLGRLLQVHLHRVALLLLADEYVLQLELGE